MTTRAMQLSLESSFAVSVKIFEMISNTLMMLPEERLIAEEEEEEDDESFDLIRDGLTESEENTVLYLCKQRDAHLDLDDMVRVVVSFYLETAEVEEDTIDEHREAAEVALRKLATRHWFTL